MGGCNGFPLSVAPKTIPSVLRHVIDHSGEFVSRDGDSLADVTAGTVIDDLHESSGCWGHYATSLQVVDGQPLLQVYEALAINIDDATIDRWSFQSDAFGFLTVAVGQRGVIDEFDADSIRWRQTELISFDPQTGDEIVMTGDDAPPLEYDWPATLSGNSLKLNLGDPVNASADDQVTYLRFDCPE
jgi:hypothetical protein